MPRFRFIAPIIFALAALAAPSASHAQIAVGLSITIAPPAIPIYVQPVIPAPGYLWTPAIGLMVPTVITGCPARGWNADGWRAVDPALLGFEGGIYGFHVGYWGPHVGFYGGINYGFGYGGIGFGGGRWEGGAFSYNTAVMNVGVNIVHNTYNERITVNNNSRAAFNGPGGVEARPTAEEEAAAHEKHIDATKEQVAHREAAAKNPELNAKRNGGKPAIAATSKPGDFTHGVVMASCSAGNSATRNWEAADHVTLFFPSQEDRVQRFAISFGGARFPARSASPDHAMRKSPGFWSRRSRVCRHSAWHSAPGLCGGFAMRHLLLGRIMCFSCALLLSSAVGSSSTPPGPLNAARLLLCTGCLCLLGRC